MMNSGLKTLRSGSSALGALAAFCCAWSLTSAGAAEAEDMLPRASLDDLVRLPASLEVETSRRGGASRAEWHTRFISARTDVTEGKLALEESLTEMEELAEQSSNWKVASPFGQPEPGAEDDNDTPLNYGLKQQIRRKREGIVRADRALLDLQLEANLANVPQEWHSPQ